MDFMLASGWHHYTRNKPGGRTSVGPVLGRSEAAFAPSIVRCFGRETGLRFCYATFGVKRAPSENASRNERDMGKPADMAWGRYLCIGAGRRLSVLGEKLNIHWLV